MWFHKDKVDSWQSGKVKLRFFQQVGCVMESPQHLFLQGCKAFGVHRWLRNDSMRWWNAKQPTNQNLQKLTLDNKQFGQLFVSNVISQAYMLKTLQQTHHE
jgi:hypothetical protein